MERARAIVWTRRARQDVNSIWDFLEQRNPRAAELVDSRILAAVERLGRLPHLGRPGMIAGTRELTVSRTPYRVVYVAEVDSIVILHVVHSARDWPPRA